MLALQSPRLRTLDHWFHFLLVLSDGSHFLHLPQEYGATHEMQIRDKTVPQEEIQTGKGALGESSEALACCMAKDGKGQV